MADRILGSQFLQDIAEFFLNFQTMYDGFVARAEAVERLMHDRRTAFVVVTTLEGAPLREAEYFCEELTKRDFHLGALVLNKTLPEYLRSREAAEAARVVRDECGAIAAELADVGVDELKDTAASERVLRTVGESFRGYAVVATREAELRQELARLPEAVAVVPALTDDVHDVSGLAAIATHLID
jgi:anion-transporting  ArsA/GET3 family ATPase